MFVFLAFIFECTTHDGASDCTNETVAKLVAAEATSCTTCESTHQTSLTILSATWSSTGTSTGAVSVLNVRVVWGLVVWSALWILVCWLC